MTNSEKEKIREEEIYRQEIIEDLKKGKNGRLSFWTFLNSSFTIFFLSTVIIGSLSMLYKDLRINQEKNQRAEVEKIEYERIKSKLTEETLIRLTAIGMLLDTIPLYQSKNVLIAFWGNSIRTDTTLKFRYYNLRPLYTEYEKWTLLELLTNLKKYSEPSVSLQISKVKEMLISKSEFLNGGRFVLSKTRNGEILPVGRLYKPKIDDVNPKLWTYITNQNKVIRLSEEKLKLTNYYTLNSNQTEIVHLVKKLNHLLSNSLVDLADGS